MNVGADIPQLGARRVGDELIGEAAETARRVATADASALVTCEAGQEPVFVLHDDYDFETMIYTRQSCTGCIDRAARMTYIGTCANVECTTDDDCLNRDGDVTPFACTGGTCLK